MKNTPTEAKFSSFSTLFSARPFFPHALRVSPIILWPFAAPWLIEGRRAVCFPVIG